ncbi:hypothetical protein LshimejAT787_0302480 [Lyophyllum shimeji]|uniref:Uncharacterized protein n=1 Tax=Lyophyllum shimeji TaxID=47721 RepID=A0A9P3PHB6_LYOSH|nr:hypothetical protein LshimejAT787_0302480 [Lyophyllum shimeji]
MQPVPCWEKVWTRPENSAPGSNLKVYKWVKTEKAQQFSDDEGGVDEPLAPLPDEPEVVEGDEEIDQDEALPENPPEATQLTETSDLTATQEELASKPPSPKPKLSISLQNNSELGVDQGGDALDASLKPMDESMDAGMNLTPEAPTQPGIGLDMSSLGPDGLALESSHNLSQMEGVDALIGRTYLQHLLPNTYSLSWCPTKRPPPSRSTWHAYRLPLALLSGETSPALTIDCRSEGGLDSWIERRRSHPASTLKSHE